VRCAEKPQKGAASSKKKKKSRGCHFRKKRFFRKELRAYKRKKKERFATKTTRAREQRLSGNKREELFFLRFVSFFPRFFPFCYYILREKRLIFRERNRQNVVEQ
jgi:hypothetical protein